MQMSPQTHLLSGIEKETVHIPFSPRLKPAVRCGNPIEI